MPALTVTTTSGTIYQFDADTRTVTRNRREATGELRRDGEALPALMIGTPTIGEQLRMVLDLRGDGTLSQHATTTDVSAVEGDVAAFAEALNACPAQTLVASAASELLPT